MITILAAVTGGSLGHQFLVLIVVGVIIGLAIWLVSISPMPEQFKKILTWLCYGAAALFLINFLWGLISQPFITF